MLFHYKINCQVFRISRHIYQHQRVCHRNYSTNTISSIVFDTIDHCVMYKSLNLHRLLRRKSDLLVWIFEEVVCFQNSHHSVSNLQLQSRSNSIIWNAVIRILSQSCFVQSADIRLGSNTNNLLHVYNRGMRACHSKLCGFLGTSSKSPSRHTRYRSDQWSWNAE